MIIREYSSSDREQLLLLWKNTFSYSSSHNDPELSLQNKLKYNEHKLLLIAEKKDERGSCICGSVMGGYDGHRGWIYSLAVDSAYRNNGIGSALMNEIEQRLKALGCVKVNLQVVAGNKEVTAFYEKLGFLEEPRISMGKKLV